MISQSKPRLKYVILGTPRHSEFRPLICQLATGCLGRSEKTSDSPWEDETMLGSKHQKVGRRLQVITDAQPHLYPPNNGFLPQRTDDAVNHMTSLSQRGLVHKPGGTIGLINGILTCIKVRLKPQNETVMPAKKNRPAKRTNDRRPSSRARPFPTCSGFPSPALGIAPHPESSTASGRIDTSHFCATAGLGPVFAKSLCSLFSEFPH
ncbi:hypothetical protein BJY00DRAFT_278328 [Aspergillus carlsbadensis]|nr:hypothetical protein BJY00DRAFT_278328 [Aspergillus carlsbadensis]